VGWYTKIIGAGASRWAVPPTLPWTMTTTVNDRTTDVRTAEQVEDAPGTAGAAGLRRRRGLLTDAGLWVGGEVVGDRDAVGRLVAG
jgi:hypothetical protein